MLYLIIMLPMYIYGTIHWILHRDRKNEVVIVRNNLSRVEWIVSSFCLVIVSIGIYFLLKLLKTKQLLVNTLSFVTMIPSVYLLARRCKWNQVAFLVNDFIVPFLWIFLVTSGDTGFIPMIIYHIFQIIYDVYGLFEWIKLEKNQKTKL